ncbi:hypothetical protein OF83DRAFT_101290 [Amylostereum chailletii]|nr:hypothetical protein OF83DRAFT_101290 [Amylostereum chailletii]
MARDSSTRNCEGCAPGHQGCVAGPMDVRCASEQVPHESGRSKSFVRMQTRSPFRYPRCLFRLVLPVVPTLVRESSCLWSRQSYHGRLTDVEWRSPELPEPSTQRARQSSLGLIRLLFAVFVRRGLLLFPCCFSTRIMAGGGGEVSQKRHRAHLNLHGTVAIGLVGLWTGPRAWLDIWERTGKLTSGEAAVGDGVASCAEWGT